MFSRILATALSVALLSGCATKPPVQIALSPEVIEASRCASDTIAVDTQFEGGALQSCVVDGIGNIAVTIAPEDEPPINCSPWYAFRVTPATASTVTIALGYTACGHRYWPKISHDGKTWVPLDASQVEVMENEGTRVARISLDGQAKPFFIAGQELVVPEDYDTWLADLASREDADLSVLGPSAEGRDLPMLTIADGGATQRETVVLVGRQHPPEVSGALAMFPFVETLLGDDELAKAFRARFQTVVVPLLNPDGVVRGHWRHATGGKDLNRDWGMFTQPETALMGDLLAQIEADPARKLVLFLDFHSTQKDVVYTLSKDLETDPAGFTEAWLADYAARLPGYEVVEDPGYSAGRGVSKNWVYDAYGVPTATFELGDETDRKLIDRLGVAAAQAMMKSLLETPR